MEELLAVGHRRIGFVNDCDDIPARSLRLAGYRQALEVYGVPFDDSLVIERSANASGGYSGATELLGRPDRPTGIFCFNDRTAMGVYQAANALGLAIPDDLSVVGFDNQELISDSLWPGLTTVALPHYEMGHAVKTRSRRLSHNSPPADSALMSCPALVEGRSRPISRRSAHHHPDKRVRASAGR